MILYFDLPTTTKKNLRDYRVFRNYILNEGFIMQQESVYSKLILNSTNSRLLIDRINENAPPTGLVEILVITEKQYSSIEMIVGKRVSEVFDSVDRLVII